VAPGPGGLDDHLKNPGTTDLFGQVGATRADRKINVPTFEPGVTTVFSFILRVVLCVIWKKYSVESKESVPVTYVVQ
jgi:hypothetical protein